MHSPRNCSTGRAIAAASVFALLCLESGSVAAAKRLTLVAAAHTVDTVTSEVIVREVQEFCFVESIRPHALAGSRPTTDSSDQVVEP